MQRVENDIISKLRTEMLKLGGIKPPAKDFYKNSGLEFLREHLPNACFPTAAMHEFICPDNEAVSASIGFISALNTCFFSPEAVIAFIGSQRKLFPASLTAFNLKPHHILCISPANTRESIWVIEEALKCKGLNAVIAEMNGVDFKQSRRFQLAVESSGVTGFLINSGKRAPSTNACVGRWQIDSIASQPIDGLPGVGAPSWNVTLDKMRNGKKGSWQLCWKNGLLQPIQIAQEDTFIEERKWAV